MGSHRIETQVRRDLYGHGAAGPGLDYPRPRNHRQNVVTTPGVAAGGYRESLPPQPYPKSKGSVDYFQGRRPSSPTHLNFIEQLAGFELTSKETFVLGGLFVLASPVIAVGMLAGCGNGGTVENGEEDGGPSTNHPPVLDPIGDKAVNENELLVFTVSASDPDGDSLTFGGESLPSGAVVDPSTGTLTWTPTFEQAGVYPNVGITASDGDLSVTQRFDINVVNVNGPPVMDPIPDQAVDENRLLTVPVTASDPDGDLLTFSGENLPDGAIVDPRTGTLTWTPSFAQAGVYPNVGITAVGGDLSATRRFPITVNNVNRAPTLDPIGDQVAEAGLLLSFALVGSDPDGDTLTYRAVGLPTGATLDVNTGQFNWTPTSSQVGNHEITFEASDGDLVARQTINIEVRGVREVLESRITNAASSSLRPSLVWTGMEYGVSWDDIRNGNYEIYFNRIDASGNKLGRDVRITNDVADSGGSSLVWTGMEYGVSWYDERDGNYEIYFARIAADGNKISSDVRITNDAASSGWPSLVWTGMEYGVSWWDTRDGNREIYFARFDAEGNKIGSDVRITNDVAIKHEISLVWSGTEYAVSWQDERAGNNDIYFTRIDAAGNKIGNDVRISDNWFGDSYRPSLVWAGSEYGVSWEDYNRNHNYNNCIYFARIDASGSKIGGDVRITNDTAHSMVPSLVWTGIEYGVSWYDDRDDNDEIYFARVTASGNKIGADVRITNDAAGSYSPSLVWTGTEYGVSWYDSRDDSWDIYFARIIGNFTPTP